jgi:cation/acetate symporter
MSLTSTHRMVNPRLGLYFAIFASCVIAVALMALMGEQLGLKSVYTNWGVLCVPVIGFCVVGVASKTRDPLEFFAAGRRVPAIYGGLNLAISALGGTGLVALTGLVFLVGFDALFLIIGPLAGFVVMGILLAPFFRKFGAYTVPSYLGRRFESPSLRVISAIIISVPLTLMLAAELKMGAFAAGFLTGLAPQLLLVAMAVVLGVTVTFGGTRALTWSGVAQSITVLLALLVPIGVVAVMWTNLPLPQLSHGPLLRAMSRHEATQSLPLVLAQGLTFDLPGLALTAITKRFATSFSVIGPAGFVAAMLTIMMGVAVAPWLLPRIATAPGVYHARKSIGWATLIFGILMLTAASIGVFERATLLEKTSAGLVPEWVQDLANKKYADITTRVPDDTRNVLSKLTFSRDAILFALPMAAGLSGVAIAVTVVGALAACLAGAASAVTALGATLAEDIAYGLKAEPPLDGPRLAMARGCIMLAIVLGATVASLAPSDPLELVLWSLALTGSSLFGVLVLSIWWKRLNSTGALAGVVSGFGVACTAIILGELEWLPLDPSLSAVVGIPASILAATVITALTPHPGRHVLELVRDIRVPGGEILYDREMRLLRVKKRQPTQDKTRS